MLSAQRHQRILVYVAAHQMVKVSDLSTALHISTSTLRRDVRQLNQLGVLRRIHGGVMDPGASVEPQAPTRHSAEHTTQKRLIGEAAAALVKDGDTIIVTGGTTTEAMLPFLAPKRDLTVITNAINIAHVLCNYPHIATVVLGGWLQHADRFVLGHLTDQALQDLQAGTMFHGVHGLDPIHGLTGTAMQAVQTDRSIVTHARELIVLADSSKFGRIGPVRMAPANAASTIVTDDGAPAAMIEALEAQGINVIRVPAHSPAHSTDTDQC
jgi:DeoR/GlpR family transcriptional regulator of sugar metabolism